MVNFILVSSENPQNLWGGEDLLTVNYILNRVPHKKLGLIPFELWHGRALPTITSKCGGALQRY